MQSTFQTLIGDKRARVSWWAIRAWIVILPLAVSFGCHGAASRRSLTSSVTTAAGAVATQEGEAREPMKLSSIQTVTTLPVPAKSVATVEATGEVKLELPAPSEIKTVTVRENFTAPQSFTPPSPSDIAVASAKASGVRWFYAAGIVSLLAAGVAAYLGHAKAALFLFAGAFLVPLVGVVVSEVWAVHVLVGIVCVAGALVGAWYALRGRIPEHLQGEITKAETLACDLKLKLGAAVKKIL